MMEASPEIGASVGRHRPPREAGQKRDKIKSEQNQSHGQKQWKQQQCDDQTMPASVTDTTLAIAVSDEEARRQLQATEKAEPVPRLLECLECLLRLYFAVHPLQTGKHSFAHRLPFAALRIPSFATIA